MTEDHDPDRPHFDCCRDLPFRHYVISPEFSSTELFRRFQPAVILQPRKC